MSKHLIAMAKYRNIRSEEGKLSEACYDIISLRENLKALSSNYEDIEAENNRLKNSLTVMTDAYDVGVAIRDKMRIENEKLKDEIETLSLEFDEYRSTQTPKD